MLWHGRASYCNRVNKVEPIQRALKELGVSTWYAGLRRVQASARSALPVLQVKDGRYKVHPIVDWTDRDVSRHLKGHDLPCHPLWERGDVSVGDRHSTHPLRHGMSAEQTGFFGLKRECGLHE